MRTSPRGPGPNGLVGAIHVVAAQRVPLGVGSAVAFLVVAALVGYVAFRRPALGIAALLVLDPFEWPHAIGPTDITLPKAALIGVVIALIARRVSLAPLRDSYTRPLIGGACAIIIVTALTAIPATYIDATAREVLKSIEYAVSFAVAALAIGSRDDEAVVRTSVVVAAGLVCLTALAQYVTGSPSGVVIGGHDMPRIAGALEGPNQLAGYLGLAIPICLASVLARERSYRITAAVLVLAIVTDVLTLSRSGFLGLVVGIVLVLLLHGRRSPISTRVLAGGAALAAVLALGAARLGVLQRFFSVGEVARDNGLGTRSELWSAAVTLWKLDPALGIGAGNFELLTPRAGLIGIRTHANSLYLQSLAEGGLALFFAVVWTIVSGIVLCLRDAPRSTLLLGIGAATIGFAAHQIFDVLTFFPKVGGFWWLLLGAASGRIYALRSESA